MTRTERALAWLAIVVYVATLAAAAPIARRVAGGVNARSRADREPAFTVACPDVWTSRGYACRFDGTREAR